MYLTVAVLSLAESRDVKYLWTVCLQCRPAGVELVVCNLFEGVTVKPVFRDPPLEQTKCLYWPMAFSQLIIVITLYFVGH